MPWYQMLINKGIDSKWKIKEQLKQKNEINLSFQPDISISNKSVLWFKSPKSLKVEVFKEIGTYV